MAEQKRGETFVMEDSGASVTPDQPLDFTSFLLGLASSALIHLGVAPNPDTQRVEQNLVLARQSLDLLSLLRTKTRGNLTADEERFFDSLLADLRLKFVEAQKR